MIHDFQKKKNLGYRTRPDALIYTNFRRNLAIFKKECVAISPIFIEKLFIFKKGVRGAVSCRVGRSPIRFFDLILNNALALRASQNIANVLKNHEK